MDIDLTQLMGSLGIGGPIVVATIVFAKRMAERFVVTQDRMVEAIAEHNKYLSTLTELTRQMADRLARVELRLQRLRRNKLEEDTDPDGA